MDKIEIIKLGIFRKFACILAAILSIVNLYAQDSTQFKQFFYPSGRISSQGYMRNGTPDGVWKSYDENGQLISEGARVNLELEGVWKFYREGKISSEITYRKGKKNGKSIFYQFKENQKIEENYIDNVLNGLRIVYTLSPKEYILKSTPYIQALEDGLEKEYNSQGEIVYITQYRKGFIVFRERINKRDRQGFKQGVWKAFYSNDKLYWEVPYLNDQKHGYYKEYDTLGNIQKIEKYQNGELQVDAPELARLEIKTEYYANGQIKISVPYKNNLPEGLCRIYDSLTGKVIKGILFKDGKEVGGGLVDEFGYLQDDWKEYYPNGTLRCQGKYRKGKKHGDWLFYFSNGQVEQEGRYTNGKLDGDWTWYYSDGQPRLQQSYFEGQLEGPSTEYDEKGKILAKGSYVEGYEDGKWEYWEQNERIMGTYRGGERHGEWKSYWNTTGKKLSFKGSFVNGLPNGKHLYYWDNGVLREEAHYNMGRRTGIWKKYNEKGESEVQITYDKNEEEERYDGVRTLPKTNHSN
ncbi:MAG: hypothetical protein RR190_00815 [Bacteroidales bacterium]